MCPDVPDDVKAVYRTTWDLDPIDLIDMAADRAPFIDQSQSLTLGVRRPTPELMVSLRWLPPLIHRICCPIHLCLRVSQKRLMLHAWRAGLKTGLYYLRTLHPASMETSGEPDQQPASSRSPDCCA